eukprot:g8521.t1
MSVLALALLGAVVVSGQTCGLSFSQSVNWRSRILSNGSGLGQLEGSPAILLNIETPSGFTTATSPFFVSKAFCGNGTLPTTTRVSGDPCWDQQIVYLRYTTDCTLLVHDEGNGYLRLSGSVDVNCTRQTKFLMLNVTQTFRLPLSFTVRFPASLRLESQATTRLINDNDCYQVAHCYGFECVLASQQLGRRRLANASKGVNFCNCSTIDPNGVPGVCTGVVHADAHCSQDTSAPVNRNCPTGALTVDLNSDVAFLSLSTLGGTYGPPGYTVPSWCDCTSPASPNLYRVAEVYRTITPPGGSASTVDLGSPNHSAWVYDYGMATYVLNTKGVWSVAYLIADVAGNVQQCNFTVNVIDTSPPNLDRYGLCAGGRELRLRGQDSEPYLDPLHRADASAEGNLSQTMLAAWYAAGFGTNDLRLLELFSQDLCDHSYDNIDDNHTHCREYSFESRFGPLLLNYTTAFGTGAVVRRYLPDGTYAVHADVYDEAGNLAWCNFTLVVDNTPPALSCGAGARVPGTTYGSYHVLLNTKPNEVQAGGLSAPLDIAQLHFNATGAQTEFLRAVERTQPGRSACPSFTPVVLQGTSAANAGGNCATVHLHAGAWYQLVSDANNGQDTTVNWGSVYVNVSGPAGCNALAGDAGRPDYLTTFSTGCYPSVDGNATFCAYPGAGESSWLYTIEQWGCDLDYTLQLSELLSASGAAAGSQLLSSAGLRLPALFLRSPELAGGVTALPSGWSLRVSYAAYDDVGNVAVCLVDYEVRDTLAPQAVGQLAQELSVTYTLPPDVWSGGALLLLNPGAVARRSLAIHPMDLWIWVDNAVYDYEFLPQGASWAAQYVGVYCGLGPAGTPAVVNGTGALPTARAPVAEHLDFSAAQVPTPVPPNIVYNGQIPDPDPAGTAWLQRRRLAQADNSGDGGTGYADGRRRLQQIGIGGGGGGGGGPIGWEGAGGNYTCLTQWEGLFANTAAGNQTITPATFTVPYNEYGVVGQVNTWLYLYPGVTTVTASVRDGGYYDYAYDTSDNSSSTAPTTTAQRTATLSLTFDINVVDETPPVFLDCVDGACTGVRSEVNISVGSPTFWLTTRSDEFWADFSLLRVADNAVLSSGVVAPGLRDFLLVTPSYGFGQQLAYGEHYITYRAVDPSGNWAECVRTIFVHDVQPPSVLCASVAHNDPVLRVVNGTVSYYDTAMDAGVCGADPTTSAGFGIDYLRSDVQGPADVIVTCGNAEGNATLAARAVRCVATATDQAGNQAQCTVVYDLQDREKPVVTCAATGTIPIKSGLYDLSVFHSVSDNCVYDSTVYTPPAADIGTFSFLQSPFNLTVVGSDTSPHSPASDSCVVQITLTGFCGDGLLDFYGEHGPAEECEVSPHPESWGCTFACTCGAGYTPDPQGGCLQVCTGGSACTLDTADLQGTQCGNGSVTTTLQSGDWRVDALKPDFTAVKGLTFTTYYVLPNCVGTLHYSYRFWERNTSSSPYVSFNTTQVTAALLLPDEQLVLEWYPAGGVNTVANVASANDALQLDVCGCDFQNSSRALAAFVLAANNTLVNADLQCAPLGLESSYNAATSCWTFRVCRTGVVVIGEPLRAEGNLLQCLSDATIVVNNSASGCSWSEASWNLDERVYRRPGTTFDQLRLVSTGTPTALYLNTTSLTLGHFAAAQTTSVTVNDVLAPYFECTLDGGLNGTSTAYGNDPGQNYSVRSGYYTRALVDETETTRYVPFDSSVATLQAPEVNGANVRFYIGTTTLTWVGADSSGNQAVNCVLQITINDVEAPQLTCPNMTVQTLPGVNYWNGTSATATAVDNFDADVQLTFPIPVPLVYTGANAFHVLTRSVDDAYGNTGFCQFAVWVLDNQAPVFTSCPAVDLTIVVGEASYVINVNDFFNVTDNSDPSPQLYYDLAVGDAQSVLYVRTLPQLDVRLIPFNLTVLVTAVDAHSGLNSTCSLRFVLLDGATPELSCPNATEPLLLSTLASSHYADATGLGTSFGSYVNLSAALAAPVPPVQALYCAPSGGAGYLPFAPCPGCSDNAFAGCAGLSLHPVLGTVGVTNGSIVRAYSAGYTQPFNGGWSGTSASNNVVRLDTCDFVLMDDVVPLALCNQLSTACPATGALVYAARLDPSSTYYHFGDSALQMLTSNYGADNANIQVPYWLDSVGVTHVDVRGASTAGVTESARLRALQLLTFTAAAPPNVRDAVAADPTNADWSAYFPGVTAGSPAANFYTAHFLAYLDTLALLLDHTLTLGANVFNFTAYDERANDATFTLTVTLTDAEPPVFFDCPPMPLVLYTSSCGTVFTPNCTFAPLTLHFGDNLYLADGVSRNSTASVSLGTVNGERNTSTTVTIFDEAGNSASCTVTGVVEDDTPPVFSNCPPDLGGTGWASRTVRIAMPGDTNTTLPGGGAFYTPAPLGYDNLPGALTTNVTVRSTAGGATLYDNTADDGGFLAAWRFGAGDYAVHATLADQSSPPNAQPGSCDYNFTVEPAYAAPALQSLVLSFSVSRLGDVFRGTVSYVTAVNYPYVGAYGTGNILSAGNVSIGSQRRLWDAPRRSH